MCIRVHVADGRVNTLLHVNGTLYHPLYMHILGAETGFKSEVAYGQVERIGSRQKGKDLTQSYDKSPYKNRNVKRAK